MFLPNTKVQTYQNNIFVAMTCCCYCCYNYYYYYY